MGQGPPARLAAPHQQGEGRHQRRRVGEAQSGGREVQLPQGQQEPLSGHGARQGRGGRDYQERPAHARARCVPEGFRHTGAQQQGAGGARGGDRRDAEDVQGRREYQVTGGAQNAHQEPGSQSDEDHGVRIDEGFGKRQVRVLSLLRRVPGDATLPGSGPARPPPYRPGPPPPRPRPPPAARTGADRVRAKRYPQPQGPPSSRITTFPCPATRRRSRYAREYTSACPTITFSE